MRVKTNAFSETYLHIVPLTTDRRRVHLYSHALRGTSAVQLFLFYIRPRHSYYVLIYITSYGTHLQYLQV